MTDTPTFSSSWPPLPEGESGKAVVRNATFIDVDILGTLVGNDMYSSNWDGTIPIDLSSGRDGGATVGYAFDASAGALQAEVAYLDGANIENLVASKITVGQIVTGQITDSAITEAKVALLAITEGKLAALSVSTAKIQALAVTAAQIDSLAVGTGQIANSAVETAKIALLAVTEGKLAALSVTTAKIDALAVTAAKIEDLAVTNAKINDLDAVKITAGTLNADRIGATSITADKLNVTSLDAITANMGTLAVDATLTMGASGLIRTAASGNRIEMGGAAQDRITFYSGGTESRTAFIQAEEPGDITVTFLSATVPSGPSGSFLQFNGTTGAATLVAGDELDLRSDGGSITLAAIGGRVILATAGSASAPQLVFSQTELDMGIYRIGTAQMGIATGGAQRVEITSTHFRCAANVEIEAEPGTTGTAANAFWSLVSGTVYELLRSTSARKYKSRINYNVAYLADIELKPTKHYRKDDKAWYYGFIADDLAEENVLLATYDDEGNAENYDQRAVLAVLAAKVNRLEGAV